MENKKEEALKKKKGEKKSMQAQDSKGGFFPSKSQHKKRPSLLKFGRASVATARARKHGSARLGSEPQAVGGGGRRVMRGDLPLN